MNKENNKLIAIKVASAIILLIDIIFNNYVFFIPKDDAIKGGMEALLDFFVKAGLFENSYISKLFIVVLIIVSSIGYKGEPEEINMNKVGVIGMVGFFLFMGTIYVDNSYLYIFLLLCGYIALLYASALISKKFGGLKDPNDLKNTFMQETRLIVNNDSINIPTIFYHKNKKYNGWINVLNPFKATVVLGIPGSGKSFAVYHYYIKQMIQKGYTIYCYDYKYDDLTKIVYSELLKNADKYTVAPTFCVINFDDPQRSHRCNPINPAFMTDIVDAYEAAYTVMINLNKTWVQKQGDFFVESPINLFTAIIWFLRIYDDGKFCTLPHAIEMLMKPYEDVFKILASYNELQNYMSPFINANEAGAQDQLQGQIASAQIPLARICSPALYWVMSGDDFSLDINNPEEPKVLCVGNNPDRVNIYASALSLYNSRIFKIINRPGRLRCGVLIDELPTVYLKGLDHLIATARSNKVAIVIGAQDQSQITRDYGEKESEVIMNTIGTVFAGQVKGRTAEALAKSFGKEFRERRSVTRSENSSISISHQAEDILPASVIGSLSQGTFVGQVADNFNEKIERKFFHAEIQVKAKGNDAGKVPLLASVENGNIKMLLNQNYNRIKEDITKLIQDELIRISELNS